MANPVCSQCPISDEMCLGGRDCSKCPAPILPNQYPPSTVPVMLAQVLQQYSSQANCPLNLTLENPEQYCYYNQFASTYTPSPGAALFPDLPTSTVIGVDKHSWVQGPTQCDQYFLVPPFDSQNVSELEFLVAPPDKNGNPQCQYFDNYSPNNCTTPQCDCTTRCMYDGSMPCVAGTTPVKVGPCLSLPSWNGWTMQGYQCKPVKWGCNWQTGKCELMANGSYTDSSECNEKCTVCPAVGFQVVTDKNGNSACYRSPYQPPDGGNCTGPNDSYAICVMNSGGLCDEDNPNACGNGKGWYAHCAFPDGYCTDTIATPYGAYQCTEQGYVQCLTEGGCPPQSVQVWSQGGNPASACILPASTTSRSRSGNCCDGSTWFQ